MNSYQSSPPIKFFRHLLSPPRKPTSPPSPDCSGDIHHVFNHFDENGDGKITASELQNWLKNKLHLSDEEAEMVASSSDADGDGVFGLEDFDDEGGVRGGAARGVCDVFNEIECEYTQEFEEDDGAVRVGD
ncbi:putative EF-hand domain pair protein CML [Helianthus anomalus]